MHKRFSAAALAVALVMAAPLSQAHAEARSWQCVTFARFFSGVQLFGDAWTWWSQAAGKYGRGVSPNAGSVLVFRAGGAMSHGHVAVVSQVLTDRIIQVTHANWSPIGGARGQVEKDVTVVDVSPSGDWSQVKVWYDPTGQLGSRVYPTYGFIYKAAERAQTFAQNSAMRVAAAVQNARSEHARDNASQQVASADPIGDLTRR